MAAKLLFTWPHSGAVYPRKLTFGAFDGTPDDFPICGCHPNSKCPTLITHFTNRNYRAKSQTRAHFSSDINIGLVLCFHLECFEFFFNTDLIYRTFILSYSAPFPHI